MKVFLIGGSGFLGRRLIAALVERGHDVSALARSASAAQTVERAGAESVTGDLDDEGQPGPAIERSGAHSLVTSVPFSMGHGAQIVAAAEHAGVERAVFVSTTSIHTSLDTASKPVRLGAEDRIMASTIDWTIVRPTMIYGAPDDRNMARLLRLLTRAPLLPLPGASRLHQPVHVVDLANAIARALEDPVAIRKVYELGGPEAIRLDDLIDQAASALGRHVRTVPVPLAPIIALAKVYERFGGKARLRAEQFERLGEDKAFDISAARTELGFRPRSFAEGIRDEASLLGLDGRIG